MRKIVIIGAGGHGRVVADIARLNGDEVIGYLDDKNPDELPGYNIIGTTEAMIEGLSFDGVDESEISYFVAVGNPIIRERLMSADCDWYTAIHPSAVIASDAEIGSGSCIMAGAVVNSGARIGKGVIVNTLSSVDHDCQIGDFVHIAPGTHISGTVTVGDRTWIGVGSAVSNNLEICSDCMIGAGAVVVKSITEPGTYVGNPARKKTGL